MPKSDLMLKIPFFERRRRIRRPWTLIIFGVAFLLLPFLNYLSITNQLHISPRLPDVTIKLLNPVELFLLLMPFLVGIGLLLVKRWGWWLFLGYSAILVVYNIYALVTSRSLYNAGALIQTVLGISAVLYFVRRDVSAPYMKMYPRGWRLQHREPIAIEVIVDGIRRTTADISDSGMYVIWEDCYRAPGEEVHVTLTVNGNEYKSRAGVVRVDDDGAGLAFRGASRIFKKNLKRDIARLEPTDAD
ncbi:MAG: PilZ domain-containing protein [Leptospirales bacterium]|nr:PilZ domain-containing protein [Leptospirales bacterium]